jgi:ADP-heptose:LPS heptosyltransferase
MTVTSGVPRSRENASAERRSPVPPVFRCEGVRRLLVIRNDNIGDVLCTTPALRALRRAFPTARIAALVPSHCRPVLARSPDVDEIFCYTKSKHAPRLFGIPALWDLGRVLYALRHRRFDLAVSLRRSFSRSSAWLAYASGAPHRLGYPAPQSHPLRFFINLAPAGPPSALHEVDVCLELLARIGVPSAGRALTLVPDGDAQARVAQRLREAGIAPGMAALIHISNRREASRWPLAAFAAAADRLQERFGTPVVLSWAPGDSSNRLFPGDDGTAAEVAKQMRGRAVLLSTPSLDDLIAAIGLSGCVLSTDGGPMHIAAALTIPQVVIFGKTSTSQWAPVSEQCAVLQRGSRADQITVEEVVGAAVTILSSRPRPAFDAGTSGARA